MENLNWTRGLWRMSTAVEMAEFVLWDEVHQLQLSDSPDTIRWKWTNDVSHLEIFGFMDVIKIKNKQQFSHNFKKISNNYFSSQGI